MSNIRLYIEGGGNTSAQNRTFRHVRDIFAAIDPEVVRRRCPHFDRLCHLLSRPLDELRELCLLPALQYS